MTILSFFTLNIPIRRLWTIYIIKKIIFRKFDHFSITSILKKKFFAHSKKKISF